jgi:hypothetical protein
MSPDSSTMWHMTSPGTTKIIHWWWDGPPCPEKYINFRDRWRELHPDWKLEIWNERRWLAEFGSTLIAGYYLGRDRWSKYAHEWGWKTNIARYVILHKYGGLWVDADLEPLRPIDPLIDQLDSQVDVNAVAALEDTRHVNNAFFASPPGGNFISAVVDGLPARIQLRRGRPSNVVTGPHYLTQLNSDRSDLLVLPKDLIYPVHWSELDRRSGSFPDSYTIHHWHRKDVETSRKAAGRTEPVRRTETSVKTPRRSLTYSRRRRVTSRSGPSRKHPPVTGIPPKILEIGGLTPEGVMTMLAEMASKVRSDQSIVEIGTYLARTTLAMAWGASRGKGAHVYGIDTWDLPGGQRFPETDDPRLQHRAEFYDQSTLGQALRNVRTAGYLGKVTLGRNFSVAAGVGWIGPPVGLLYVDGDHRYQAVWEDIRAWAVRMATGALIVFDDYESGHPDVIQAVDEMVSAKILKPVDVRHNRVAVTGLTQDAVVILSQTEDPAQTDPQPSSPPEGGEVPEESGSVLGGYSGPTREGELDDVPVGTDLSSLSVDQLRVVALGRGVSRAEDRRRSHASILAMLIELDAA